MFKKTPLERVTLQGRVSPLLVGFFVVIALVSGVALKFPGQSDAATLSTINFQARLQTNTGALVPDGNYNVQFKLYSASSGGTALWTETYQNSASQGVTVKNGYLTTNLGSISSFPGTINWDQDLFITMNIGGTSTGGSPAYDGEMNPRLKLTGVPYAFKAGQLAKLTSGNTSTLDFATQTGARSILLPDESGTICIQNSLNCGFLTSGSASGNFVQLQGGTPGTAQTGNLNITGTGIADVLQGTTKVLTALLDTASAGVLSVGTTNATSIALNQNVTIAAGKNLTFTAGAGNFNQSASTGTFSTGTGAVSLNGNTTLATGKTLSVQGTATFQNNVNSNNAYLFNDATGASALSVDTVNRFVGIGKSSPTATLDVAGVGPSYFNNFETGVMSPFTTNDATKWSVATTSSYGGAYSLFMTNTGGGLGAPAAQVTQTLSAPGVVSFYYNCSWTWQTSFQFQIDSGTATDLTGACTGLSANSTWSYFSTAVGSGSHTFKWTVFPGNGNVGSSMAIKVDNVNITNVGTTGTSALFNGGGVGINLGTGVAPSYMLDVKGDARFKNVTDTTTAFQIQNANGVNIFNIDTTNGELEVGNYNGGTNAVAGKLVVANAFSASTVTVISGTQTGNYTASIPVLSANDTFCMAGLANCGGSGANVSLSNLSGVNIGATALNSTSNNLNLTTTTSGNIVLNSAGTIELQDNTNISGNVVLSAGSSLSIAGGITSSRPSTPTEGMMYFDTTTKQLLTYANGKWQADGKEAILVAANNSSDADKAAADYVADNINDQVEINNALSAANPASGSRKTGKVYLFAGTYTILDSISVPNNTTLTGAGYGSVIQFGTLAAQKSMVINTDTTTGTGAVVENLTLDGVSGTNGGNARWGISFTGMGSSSSISAVKGSVVRYINTRNFSTGGVALTSSNNNEITAVKTDGSFGVTYGIYLQSSNQNRIKNNNVNTATNGISLNTSSQYNVISGNIIDGPQVGLSINSNHNTITDNNVLAQTSIELLASYNTVNSNRFIRGLGTLNQVVVSGTYNTLAENYVYNSGAAGLYMLGANNTLSGNTIVDSGADGITLLNTPNAVIRGNQIINSGGSGSSSGINLNSSVSTAGIYIANNTITDTAGTGYAINILGGANTVGVYLGGNTFSGTGAATINDAGTGTIYGGQSNAASGLNMLFKQSNSTSAFAIQNANGVNVFNIDTTNGELEVGNYNGGTNPVAGKLVVANAVNANTVTVISATQTGNYTASIPALSANDTFCMVGLANCGSTGSKVTLQGSTPGTPDTGSFNVSGTGIAAVFKAADFDRASAGTLTIGNTNATTINIGTNAAAHTIAIGTGAAAQDVTIGSTNTTSVLHLQTGSNGFSLNTSGTTIFDSSAQGFVTFRPITDGGNIFRIQSAPGYDVLYVNTTSTDALVGINGSLAVQSSITASSYIYTSSYLTLAPGSVSTFLTPGGTAVPTKINITTYDPGSFGQVLALGIPSTTAATSSRVISVFDGRTSAHQPSIALFSPDENNVFGLSWDGSNSTAALKSTTAALSLQVSGVNALNVSQSSTDSITRLGNASTNTGKLQFANASTGNLITLQAGATSSAYTLTLPTALGATGDCLKDTGSGVLGFGACGTGGGGGGVTLQGSTPGTADTGNFNISGVGIAATFQASDFDRASAGTLTFGNTNATTINIGTNAAAHTINIGTGAAAQSIKIGSTNSNSELVLQTGTNGFSLNVSGVQTFVTNSDGHVIFRPVNNSGAGDAFEIQNASGANTYFRVNTTASPMINLDAPLQTTSAIISYSNIQLRSGSTSGYLTPGGSTIPTAINIETFNPGNYGQVLAFGIPSSSPSTARVLTVLDARTSAHQPSIAVISPDENNLFGLSWDGSNSVSSVKTTANTLSLQANGLDLLTLSDPSDGSATLTIGTGGMTNAVLQFSNSTNGNTAAIKSGVTSTSYISVLPTAIGTAGQCLSVASVSSATQSLGYANCALSTDTTNFVRNQTSQQSSTNFNISGTGVASILQAGTVDTSTSAALNVGTTNASSISLGKTSSNIQTTVNGTTLFKPTTGNDSTTAVQIQKADSTPLFTADTSNMQIIIGDTTNGIILSPTGLLLKGTARHAKVITLTAAYLGAVLDAGTGSNNTGTMTNGIDLTSRMNYYKWTTTQGTNQSYDIDVQVPIPSDFDAWNTNPLSLTAYTSNTTNGTVTLETRDTGGSVICNFVSVTPGSTSTWATNNSACTLSTGTYTAGGYMTLRIRLQSPTSGDVRVGNIVLSYLSKF